MKISNKKHITKKGVVKKNPSKKKWLLQGLTDDYDVARSNESDLKEFYDETKIVDTGTGYAVYVR